MQATASRKCRSSHSGALIRPALVTLTATAMLAAATAPSLGVPGQQSSARDLLRQAMHSETALGDTDQAIVLYEQILGDLDFDPDTLGRAGLLLANLYQKLGESEAARHSLRRVLEASNVGNEYLTAAREALASLNANFEARAANMPQALPASGGVDLDISPDGLLGAFTVYDERGQNVGVIDYATGDKTRISDLTWETGVADLPVWSPDGRNIAYSQTGLDGVTEIRVVEPGGGAARVVHANRRTTEAFAINSWVGDWLPDGESLAVTDRNGDGSATVGVLKLDSGQLTALRTIAWPGWAPRPRVSPDGQFLVITEGVTEQDRDLYILAVDGSSMERLTEHPASEQEAFWSRDGSEILFVSNRLGDDALWGIPVSGGRPSGRAHVVREGVVGTAYRWVGDRLSYLGGVNISDIFTVQLDPDTRSVAAPPRQVPYQPTGSNLDPVFSPDGTALAFVSRPSVARARIVLLRDGTEAAEFRIPDALFYPFSTIRFTPDGSRISVISYDRSERMILAIVDLATGRWALEPISDRIRTRRFEWADDGKSYYYVGQDDDRSTFIARGELGSAESTVLYRAETGASATSLALKPDANELLFSGLPGQNLRALDLTTGAVRELAAPGGFIADVEWSPDGDKLLMVYVPDVSRLAESQIVILDLATRHLQPLELEPPLPLTPTGPQPVENPSLHRLDWSLAGDRIAFDTLFISSARHLIPDPLEVGR